MTRQFWASQTVAPCVARPAAVRAVLLLGAVSLLPCEAYAQAAPPTQIETVVVTAEKRAENIQTVPMTIDAIGADQLHDRQIQTIADLATTVPGLRTDDVAGMSNIAIRGIGTTFTTGAGESSVAVHIDGIYIPQPKAALMGEDDLEQVEVLRGPQGTLYGRNSTAGVINFITASPTGKTEAGVSLRYGNYNDVRAQGYVSGSLSDDVQGRIYLTSEHHDGWGTNIETGQQINNLDSYGGRGTLDWTVKPWWTMELKVGANREGFSGPLYQPFNGSSLIFGLAPPLFSTLKPGDVKSFQHYGSSRQLETVSLKNDFTLSDDITLTSLTGYVHFQSLYDFDGFAAVIEPPFPVATAQPPVTLKPFTESSAISQEFDLKGNMEDFKWLAGLYYFYEDQNNHSTSLFDALGSNGLGAIPFPFYTNLVHQTSTRDSVSAFIDGTYSITPEFRVFGGARVLNEKLDQNLTVISSFGIAAPGDFPVTSCSPATSAAQHLDNTAVTGRAGVQYDITGSSMAYGQFSTGYKAGGFSQTSCGNQYKPETVQSGEIGYKSQWFDNRLTFNVAAYHYDYKNLEIEQATLFGVPIINAPRAHVWGADLTILGQITDQLRVDATATFLDARYDQFYNQDGTFGVPTCANPAVPASCPAGSNLAGTPLNKAPEAAATIGANYLVPTSIGDLDLRAETYLTSSYHLREFNFPYTKQNGYAIVNLYATLMMSEDRYEVRGFAKNITDKRYITGIDGIITGALGSYSPPALYGFEVSAKL
jgi:iron complex outermembrane recepter protein